MEESHSKFLLLFDAMRCKGMSVVGTGKNGEDGNRICLGGERLSVPPFYSKQMMSRGKAGTQQWDIFTFCSVLPFEEE